MRNLKIIIIFVIIVIFLAIAVLVWGSGNKKNIANSLDNFAKCLASKNITMYSAYYCSHCEDQKNLFGDSFKYVPYVECTDDPQKCVDAAITGTPTWIFPDGARLIGEQSLETLSQKSGCAL